MCTLENACVIIDVSSDEAGDVEIVDWRSTSLHKDKNSSFDFIDDANLKKLIQNCLRAENSKGMLRVIYKSLLPLYRVAKPDYLNSIEFQEMLQRTSLMIEKKPKFKFSHIKSVCENLRRNTLKKRLSFITLGSNIRRNRLNNDFKRVNGKIIDVDSVVDCGDKNDAVLLEETKANEEKENQFNSTVLQIEQESTITDTNPETLDTSVDKHEFIQLIDKKDNIEYSAPNLSQNLTCSEAAASWDPFNNSLDNLLIAKRVELPTDDELKIKINSIELKITRLKKRIEELEETEVHEDNNYSPYIMCEAYKEKVVNLYKELCELTQSAVVKTHAVRLSVLEGHSEEPVKILEKFLNNNMQTNGYPLFPDFNDVKICVVLANDIHKLGWDSTKVMKEARTLFIQCGRALQKLRQGREWKDLLANVKKGHCEDDPALHDPELMAKLEANKQQAIKREMDIIEKYAQIESEGLKKRKKHKEVVVTNDYVTSDSDEESVILCEEDMIKNEEFFRQLREQVKIEKVESIEEKTHNDITQIKVKEECEVKVEYKPLSKQLEDLGDDFTVTIEVDDPFLIVEVSSDSDDDVEVL